MAELDSLDELRRRLGVVTARERVSASTEAERFLPLVDRILAWPEEFYFAEELMAEFGFARPRDMNLAFREAAGLPLSLLAHRARIDHALVLLATTDISAAQIVYFYRSSLRPWYLNDFDENDAMRQPGLLQESQALDGELREYVGVGLGEVMRLLRPTRMAT